MENKYSSLLAASAEALRRSHDETQGWRLRAIGAEKRILELDRELASFKFVTVRLHERADYVMAHMWVNLSAAQGHKKAVKARDILAKKMTPDQIAEAQRLAREWKPKK